MCNRNYFVHTCPGCAVKITPSQIVLHHTFHIIIQKIPKEIHVHITRFLVFCFLLVIDPFASDANLVLILRFSWRSFRWPGVSECPGAGDVRVMFACLLCIFWLLPVSRGLADQTPPGEQRLLKRNFNSSPPGRRRTNP